MSLTSRARDQLRFAAYATGLRSARHVYQWPSDAWEREWKQGDWDYMADPAEVPRYALLAGLITSVHPGSVLDIGCGTGTLRSHLRDDAFTSYLGVDLSETAVHRAGARDFVGSTFAVANATTDALTPADTVVLNEVVYLFDNPAAFIERIPELVTRGGQLLVAIYRHPGDVVQWRALDRIGTRLDLITVRNGNPKAPYGTRIAQYRIG